jgi:cytidylate kinase
MGAQAERVRGRPTIITVTGHIGSGKSEVCRELSRTTTWKVVSTGALFREIASNRGMSVLELNQFAESHPDVDEEVDGYVQRLADSLEPIIVDSRLAWHFLPCSLKVYLVVDPEVAGERIFKAVRSDERYESALEAVLDSKERQRVETERFRRVYSADCAHWRNYDLIADTSHASSERVAELVLAAASRSTPRAPHDPECWLSPKRLIPTQDIRELASTRVDAVWENVRRSGFDNTSAIDVVVYEDSYLIFDGHARVSAALRSGEGLIRCKLAAFQTEEVLPGLSASHLARTSTALSWMYDWEDAHRFRFESYPTWLKSEERCHRPT